MIGLVVVSHSRTLADAAVGLATEMVDETNRPKIAVAAGLDQTTFGTDATAVAEAIEKVDGTDGVLVLLDLGSAVLSAELALEFLDRTTVERVVVSSAPLVEGLVAAVVTAAAGAPIATVVQEAERSLAAKQEHLGATDGPAEEHLCGATDGPADDAAGDEVPVASDGAAGDGAAGDEVPVPSERAAADRPPGHGGADGPPDDAAGDEVPVTSEGTAGEVAIDSARTIEITVSNAHGLHARPAARLVSLVAGFDARVTLTDLDSESGPVDAGSLSKVATLNVRQHHRLEVTATGADSQGVLDAVAELADRGFGDAEPPATQEPRRRGPAEDQPVATGSGLDIAIGSAVLGAPKIDLSGYQAGSAEDELTASQAARTSAVSSIRDLRDAARHTIGGPEADVFDAHLALLDDPAITESVGERIRDGATALDAWTLTLDALTDEFQALDDSYQRERAQDVRSVLRRIQAVLVGADADDVVDASGILVVPELDVATAATLDPEQISGVVTARGGATGHGVLVAKSRGVPILTDVGPAAADVGLGDVVAFDARSGRFVHRPDPEQTAWFTAEIRTRETSRADAVEAAFAEAVTDDGCRVTVAANVASVEEAVAAQRFGAEGSGLLRTEVLFGAESELPSVDVQTERYLAIAHALDGACVTVRTWDVGGDKPLAFMPHSMENNPFLGERGLRLSRRAPHALHEQLRAVCLAARETLIRVMFPMVTALDEVEWALAQLAKAADAATGGLPSTLEVGIMIEVPAAALRAGRLASKLDFVSIGTNDLTQYTTATDRGNSAVAALADSLDPVVLRLIDTVCRAVPDRVTVAVCGDLASQPSAAGLLVGLGVRELSCVGAAVPEVKAAVRATSLAAAERLAGASLDAACADEVRDLLSRAGPSQDSSAESRVSTATE